MKFYLNNFMKIYATNFIKPSAGIFQRPFNNKKPNLNRVGFYVLRVPLAKYLLGQHHRVDDVNHAVAGLDICRDDRGTVNGDAIAGIQHQFTTLYSF